MKNEIYDIHEELNNAFYDLKAEVLVSEIEEKTSVSEEDIVISNQSTFNRSYRRDVTDIKLVHPKKHKDLLQFNLARNGIYDLLPEGVFHTPTSDSSSYPSFRKQQKKEETDARLLFSPIENELFHQRVKIEKNEKTIEQNFTSLKDKFLLDFWKIDSSIPKKYASKLIRLLPYAHQISGNLELTFLGLEKILETNIRFKKTFRTRTIKTNAFSDNRLGVDFVLHQEKLRIQQPLLVVTIMPNDKNEIQKFLQKQGLLDFVLVFYKYFIPVEFEIETNFEVNKKEGFIIDQTKGSFLGMSTQL